MEPPLLYLHSLGIVSDEINATHEIRLRKLRDRDVLVSNDARTLHSRRHAVQFASIFAAHTSAVAVKRNAKM